MYNIFKMEPLTQFEIDSETYKDEPMKLECLCIFRNALVLSRKRCLVLNSVQHNIEMKHIKRLNSKLKKKQHLNCCIEKRKKIQAIIKELEEVEGELTDEDITNYHSRLTEIMKMK